MPRARDGWNPFRSRGCCSRRHVAESAEAFALFHKWLASEGLERYSPGLAAQGYDDLRFLADMRSEEEDQIVQALTMPQGHANRFRGSLRRLRNRCGTGTANSSEEADIDTPMPAMHCSDGQVVSSSQEHDVLMSDASHDQSERTVDPKSIIGIVDILGNGASLSSDDNTFCKVSESHYPVSGGLEALESSSSFPSKFSSAQDSPPDASSPNVAGALVDETQGQGALEISEDHGSSEVGEEHVVGAMPASGAEWRQRRIDECKSWSEVKELVSNCPTLLKVDNPAPAVAPALLPVEPKPVNFDPVLKFSQVFAEASRLVGEVLNVRPQGDAYTEATSCLHCLASILDNMFNAWGCPEELEKKCRLRPGGKAFEASFGDHRAGNPMRALLQLAGFEPTIDAPVAWTFCTENASAMFQALTVRLCLEKLAEKQKVRGALRWSQSSNAAVVPQLGDASILEVLLLHRATPFVFPELRKRNSRERDLETAVRAKLNDRRHGELQLPTLAFHDGLASAARLMAQALCERTRLADGDLGPTSEGSCRDAEARAAIAHVPLAPGCEAVHMHWASDTLPSLFALGSTTGKSDSWHVGDDNAADVLSADVVGIWFTRFPANSKWDHAVLCGVGAALDYTVNRGFVVAFLVGFPGRPPPKDGLALKAARHPRPSEVVQKATTPSWGARVHTLGQSSAVPLQMK